MTDNVAHPTKKAGTQHPHGARPPEAAQNAADRRDTRGLIAAGATLPRTPDWVTNRRRWPLTPLTAPASNVDKTTPDRNPPATANVDIAPHTAPAGAPNGKPRFHQDREAQKSQLNGTPPVGEKENSNQTAAAGKSDPASHGKATLDLLPLKRAPAAFARTPINPNERFMQRQQKIAPSQEVIGKIVEAGKRRIEEANAHRRSASVETPSGQTRTIETIQSYKSRGEQLLRRYQREKGLSNDIDEFDATDFASWVISLRQGIKPATWRFYRQGALTVVGASPSDLSERAISMLEGTRPGDIEMGTSDWKNPLQPRRLTSAQKEKHFKKDEFDRIIAYCDLHMASPRMGILKDWLLASIVTGLRPEEWQATEVVQIGDATGPGGFKTYLIVLNAKTTNGRGNGLSRTLDISWFQRQTIETIRRMSSRGLQWNGADIYVQQQSQTAQALYRICKSLWKRRKTHYSLYSCRHQFIANMKSIGVANEAVSAMVGHMIDSTAEQHYGKKRSGWAPSEILERPLAIEDEVKTVKKVLNEYERRNTLSRIIKGEVSSDHDMDGISDTYDPAGYET